jgi:chromosomal replication initiator protein
VGGLLNDTIAEIRGRIEQKVGPQRFGLWFQDSTHFAFRDEYLEVGVANPFIGGWIETHFTDQIAEAAREVTGKDVQVAYHVNPALMNNVRSKRSDSAGPRAIPGGVLSSAAGRRARSAAPPRVLRGRLENFVVGRSNRFAFNAAQAVVETPNGRYGPLFIHGGCGLGKTHLLQGVANAVAEKHRNLKWACLSGEEFTNRFLTALRGSRLEELRQHLRHLDVLIIDDVHFLANKKATQEEFLHTFNAIESVGKQVVMASDSHPKLISQLSASLTNRFVSGMVVKIDPPDFETRCEILRRRATQIQRQIPEPVIEYVAESLDGSVRELEGALLKLTAFSTVAGQPITLALAKQALADHINRTSAVTRVSDIETVVVKFFGLSAADLHTSRKARTIALARALAMFLARKHTEMSFPEIGRFIGNKNHSTVILACNRLAKTLEQEGTVCWRTPTGKSEMRLSELLGKLEEQLAQQR